MILICAFKYNKTHTQKYFFDILHTVLVLFFITSNNFPLNTNKFMTISNISTILPTAYFPNIQYFTKIINTNKTFIEIEENFPKQTFRNRCQILGANGILNLTVPVTNGRSGKIKTKDIKLNYAENWQHQHFQSIKSAYSSSPFYEFYIDEIKEIFDKKFDFLIDLNNEILSKFTTILSIDKKIKTTSKFIKNYDIDYNDFRFLLSPKVKYNDGKFAAKKYIQVFEDRCEFAPNLSILDLIFNVGNESLSYLITCIAE